MESTNLSKLWDGWTPPEGLKRSRPRHVVLSGGGITLYVLAAVMLAGGIFGAVWFARDNHRRQTQARLMLAEGRETDGTVTRLWRGGGKSNEHRVAYQFTVDGREYTGHATLRSGYWNSLRVGSPIPVRYLPSAPVHHYPSANPPSLTPAWVPFLIAGMFAVPSILLPLRVGRQRRLLEDGRPAPAVVTRQRRLHTQHGTQNVLYYQFALPEGGVCKGRSSFHGKSMPAVDSAICILYDPDNPRRSAPYPMCMVKLATD